MFINHVQLINWRKTMESPPHSNCFICVRDTMSISYLQLINWRKTMKSLPHKKWSVWQNVRWSRMIYQRWLMPNNNNNIVFSHTINWHKTMENVCAWHKLSDLNIPNSKLEQATCIVISACIRSVIVRSCGLCKCYTNQWHIQHEAQDAQALPSTVTNYMLVAQPQQLIAVYS